MTPALLASLWLVGAPFCPAGHAQTECDAVWAAANAEAASRGGSYDPSAVNRGAGHTNDVANTTGRTVLPARVRAGMIRQASDTIAGLAGTTVTLTQAIYFEDGDGLLCGAAFFGDRLQTFFLSQGQFRRAPSKSEMEAVGCFRSGGLLLIGE